MENLYPSEWDALHVLAHGMASTWRKNVYDPDKHLRAVTARAAKVLIGRGLARKVPQWDAVEITDAGRDLLAARSAPSHVRKIDR